MDARISVSLEAALDAGALKGADAAKARAAYKAAHDALLAARSAHAAGDTALEALRAGAALSAIADIQALMKV